jgi:hemerythrin-like metal-binding protein
MLHINWAPDLETGNTMLDADHKMVIDKINKLAVITNMGQSHNTTFLHEYDNLVQRIQMHFALENSMLNRHLYDDTILTRHVVKHIQAHSELVANLNSALYMLQNQDFEIANVPSMLYSSYIGHVRQLDRELAYLLTGDEFYLE